MMPKNVPDGFTAVKVETGINDDNNIEIVSGLSEGDVVYVTQSTNTMSGIESMMRMRGEMMGEGMPSGGMPSGGMMGGRP